jgi:hypothetical protein
MLFAAVTLLLRFVAAVLLGVTLLPTVEARCRCLHDVAAVDHMILVLEILEKSSNETVLGRSLLLSFTSFNDRVISINPQ